MQRNVTYGDANANAAYMSARERNNKTYKLSNVFVDMFTLNGVYVRFV